VTLHLQVDVAERWVLVVSAGRAGLEKAHRLASSGARVTVVAPVVTDPRLSDAA
jgi:precorrin-2 dehydrogenase / sirohydrochlorin ferrochelatase